MKNISFDENSSEEQSSHKKREYQLIWAGIGLIVVVLVIVGWQYWQYVQNSAYRQIKAIEELEKARADYEFKRD